MLFTLYKPPNCFVFSASFSYRFKVHIHFAPVHVHVHVLTNLTTAGLQIDDQHLEECSHSFGTIVLGYVDSDFIF